jgi:hypothetical protein
VKFNRASVTIRELIATMRQLQGEVYITCVDNYVDVFEHFLNDVKSLSDKEVFCFFKTLK